MLSAEGAQGHDSWKGQGEGEGEGDGYGAGYGYCSRDVDINGIGMSKTTLLDACCFY